MLAAPDGYRGAAIEGDKDHPSNFGRLCSKGSALGETLALETRQLFPLIEGARCGWDAALDHVASGFSRIVERHGPKAVAFYLSGQLLTEDYYVANKLMKGFIGSARLTAAMFLGPASNETRWGVMREAFAAERLDGAARRLMLSGRGLSGAPDLGPNVCACFGAPHGAILAAVADGRRDPAAIGARLKAGTNCGSCIPEMKRMIAAFQPEPAAA